MNTADSTYLALLRHVMKNGKVKKDRTGVGTISVFGYEMRFDLSEGFTLLTTKYIHHPAVIHELLWFLRGDTDIQYLVQNGVRIWNEWPHAKYMKIALSELDDSECVSDPARVRRHFTLEEFVAAIKNNNAFASKFGDVGRIYGAQMTRWSKPVPVSQDQYAMHRINQIENLVNDLRNNPDSRRHLVTMWNPAEIADVALPPCHYGFQCYTSVLPLETRIDMAMKKTGLEIGALNAKFVEWLGSFDYMETREHAFLTELGVPERSLSLKFNMRSVDCFLGMPFDIASYSALTHMLCQVLNYVPGELIVTSGDTHIYLNHFEQVNEQLAREPFENLPALILNPSVKDMFEFKYEDFAVKDYKYHPAIKAPVAV